MAELVRMKHPKVEGEAEVSVTAFENVWKPLGWRRADEKAAEPAAPKEK